MPRPRKSIVCTLDTPFYHCISRCVRRAFLCGDDHFTGQNYDHRKAWLVNRIQQLASIFAIDICAYAVMSNHYHIVVHIHDAEAKAWTDDEVLKRWSQLFNGPLVLQHYLSGKMLSELESKLLSNFAADYRSRLADLSWFMRCLNEPIARDANREDQCTGRFWEGRFKSQALLDEGALLSCMAYVDLNPVRAGLADSLESSDFTSIQQRLFEFARDKQSNSDSNHSDTSSTDSTASLKPLFPFIGDENKNKIHAGLLFNTVDYFQLVDWTGRCIRDNKRGYIPDEVIPILDKLHLPPELWLDCADMPIRSTLLKLKIAA